MKTALQRVNIIYIIYNDNYFLLGMNSQSQTIGPFQLTYIKDPCNLPRRPGPAISSWDSLKFSDLRFLQWWDSPKFSEMSSGLTKINCYKYPCVSKFIFYFESH